MAADKIANPVGLFDFEHDITQSDEEMIKASQEIEKPEEDEKRLYLTKSYWTRRK